MRMRVCDQCEKVLEKENEYAPLELQLQIKKRHIGDGAAYPKTIIMEFCSIECLKKGIENLTNEKPEGSE